MPGKPENPRQTNQPRRLLHHLGTSPAPAAPPLIGVLEGTGIGPEVVGAALQVLSTAGQLLDLEFEVQPGPELREQPIAGDRSGLSVALTNFCADIFQRGGAILNGPCGGRYVYDLRRRFDLFCKFVPVRSFPELAGAGRLAPQFARNIDLLIVRDNIGGVYQGRWSEHKTADARVAEHAFAYREAEVSRLVTVAARAAAERRGELQVILKDGGVPAISALWRDVAVRAARSHGVEASFINIDLAAYELIQNPGRFDVIVAPNLFGDVMADVAGVLMASRGVTFSGNFDPAGHGVYQTNHGCAHDLAGLDVANPAGQILSLAMLLRESFGLFEAAGLIETSLRRVWRDGWRTADLGGGNDDQTLGTRAMTDKVVETMLRTAAAGQPA
jgi:3-isopropylmalate dehydrogenase